MSQELIEKVSMLLIELAEIYIERSKNAHCQTEKHNWDEKARKCEDVASEFLVFTQLLPKKTKKRKTPTQSC